MNPGIIVSIFFSEIFKIVLIISFKVLLIILFAIFTTVFLVFYKGLQNSNIYIPMKNIEKNIPYVEIKKFASNDIINSNEIFQSDKFEALT